MRGHHLLFIIHESGNFEWESNHIREERAQIGQVAFKEKKCCFRDVKILQPTRGFLKKNDVPTI